MIILYCFRSPSWYSFIKSVLNQNHLVVEKYLSDVLTAGLTQCQDSGDVSLRHAQDAFLSDLVQFYVKLRRMPELLNALLSAADAAEGEDAITVMRALPKFSQRLV